MQLRIRRYGNKPYRTAVVHGGPGAAGEMATVARKLAEQFGVLEPMQCAGTVDGQIEELHELLHRYGETPVRLAGYSWGAWLSMMLASRYPQDVMQLVLISSGPFEEKYVAQLQENRLSRLDAYERSEYVALVQRLENREAKERDSMLARLGALASKADMYDAVPEVTQRQLLVQGNGEIYQKVWQQAARWRKEGKLLRMAARVKCPVTVIHGTADPHPAEGVRAPLASMAGDFRFHLLDECGHKPWIERKARENFYHILFDELTSPLNR